MADSLSDEFHRKRHSSSHGAQREGSILRLVAGEGIVESIAAEGLEVVTRAGEGSVADLLSERGGLPEAEARGVGAHVARSLARVHDNGIVHGDIKPANVVFAPDGGLWLIDFDAAASVGRARHRGSPGRMRSEGPLDPGDDVAALATMVVECVTGTIIDSTAAWDVRALVDLGCSLELAADVTLVLSEAPTASRVSAILQRQDDDLPTAPTFRNSPDPTPTVDIASVAIAGLDPVGLATACGNAPARRGWRGWASRARA